MGRKCLTREEITRFLQNHKKEMKRRFGVESIGLFGSYARDEAREDSDIDIVVMLNSEHLADDYFGVLHYLEDRLQHKIDLGLETNLRPEIRNRIKEEIIYV